MWSNPQHPLIPAKAGTQMDGFSGGFEEFSDPSNPHRRYSIWVPAFAGMSGSQK